MIADETTGFQIWQVTSVRDDNTVIIEHYNTEGGAIRRTLPCHDKSVACYKTGIVALGYAKDDPSMKNLIELFVTANELGWGFVK